MGYYNTENSNQIVGYSDIITKYIGNTTDAYVVDVGAHDGYIWSNSWPLINSGWGGLLIEPHPNFVAKIKGLYKGNDKVTILQMAVSNKTGETILYECSGQGALSTIKKDMIEGYKEVSWAADAGKVTGNEFTVPMDTLDNILESNNTPIGFDVFTLDCEGSEEDVLNGFTIDKWKPKMVIVETLEIRDSAERAKLDMKGGEFYKYCDELFDTHGYDKVFVDAINTIYVRK
jgi:FkbM family methyltransferase